MNDKIRYGGHTPLGLAASGRKVDATRALVDRGANLNEEQYPIHGAVSIFTSEARDIARILLNANADVNAQNQLGQTALQVAILRGNIAFSNMLREEYNADPRMRTNEEISRFWSRPSSIRRQ